MTAPLIDRLWAAQESADNNDQRLFGEAAIALERSELARQGYVARLKHAEDVVEGVRVYLHELRGL